MIPQKDMLRTGALPAVPAVLSTLTNDPTALQLLETLSETALAPYSPIASALWLMREEIPMLWDELDLPSASALWHEDVSGFVSDEFDDIVQHAVFTGLVTSKTYQIERAKQPKSSVQVSGVSVPIVACGLVVGAYGFASEQELTLHAQDVAQLTVCANAIALWVYQHPAVSQWFASNSELRDVNTRHGVSKLPVTDMQRRILTYLYHGHSVRNISAKLDVSVGRIQREIQRVCVALGVTTKTAAIARAKAHGLIND